MVVHTTESRIVVGRFDKQDELGIHMIGVSVHESSSTGMSGADFLTRTRKFGVRVDRPHLVIPSDQVREITPLGALEAT